MIKKIIKKESGYTLIETMIATSLFIIIVMIGMGALINANVVYNKSQSMRSIMDNLSFVVEDMSRNLRTGYDYRCILTGVPAIPPAAKSCENGAGIVFEEATGIRGNDTDQWVYYINSGKILKSTDGGVSYVQMTPDEIVINSSSIFSVLGAESPTAGNMQQPFVIIRLVGSITYKNVVTPFSIQTSVSQRAIDI